MKPDEHKVIKILLRANSDLHQKSCYGVLKGTQYYNIKPVYSETCKCVTSHELIEIKSDDIDKIEYPENQKYLNELYEDYLT
jgi:hypothetical protein